MDSIDILLVLKYYKGVVKNLKQDISTIIVDLTTNTFIITAIITYYL